MYTKTHAIFPVLGKRSWSKRTWWCNQRACIANNSLDYFYRTTRYRPSVRSHSSRQVSFLPRVNLARRWSSIFASWHCESRRLSATIGVGSDDLTWKFKGPIRSRDRREEYFSPAAVKIQDERGGIWDAAAPLKNRPFFPSPIFEGSPPSTSSSLQVGFLERWNIHAFVCIRCRRTRGCNACVWRSSDPKGGDLGVYLRVPSPYRV